MYWVGAHLTAMCPVCPITTALWGPNFKIPLSKCWHQWDTPWKPYCLHFTDLEAGQKLLKKNQKVLMERECPLFLENQKDPLVVDKIMQNLDPHWDGTVGLWNVLSLVAGLSIPCSDCSVVHPKPEEEEKAESHTQALFLHWWAFFSRITWKSCPNAFVNSLGPLGIVQITLNFKLTRKERNVSSMTETFLIFILFAPSFPQ